MGELARRPFEFLGHTMVLILIKSLVLFPLALVFGYRKGDAARITFLLAQAGEFGFVLFGSAAVLEVIDESIFITAVGVISITVHSRYLILEFLDALAQAMPIAAESALRSPHSPPCADTDSRPIGTIAAAKCAAHRIGTALISSAPNSLNSNPHSARLPLASPLASRGFLHQGLSAADIQTLYLSA